MIETEIIQSILKDDEILLWKGKPKSGIEFSSIDILLIPITIMFGVYAITWECDNLERDLPLIFHLFGISFVLLGLYIIFGRFLADALLRKNTFYVVTNKRLIIICGILKRKTLSIELKNLQGITINEKGDGSGLIGFNEEANKEAMDIYDGMSGERIGRIDGVREVYSIIINAQREPKGD